MNANRIRCADTRALFEGKSPRRFRMIEKVAVRKLQQVHAAADISFLRAPPGNRLEKLRGERDGQWSIRINDQWRVCFEWHENRAVNIEIIDYH